MEFGITGPAYTISTACCSANHAIGQAFWMVRNGMVDLAIAGGSEAPFSFGILKAWEAMRVVSPDTCPPFSKDRRGLILGEGGAMLILEPLAEAKARSATIHAEVVGFGMSSDAHHVTLFPSMAPSARHYVMQGFFRSKSGTSTLMVPAHRSMIPWKRVPFGKSSAPMPTGWP
jgi:nodulation protein E